MIRRPFRKWLKDGAWLLLGMAAAFAFLAVMAACTGYMTVLDFQSDDTPNYEKTI